MGRFRQVGSRTTAGGMRIKSTRVRQYATNTVLLYSPSPPHSPRLGASLVEDDLEQRAAFQRGSPGGKQRGISPIKDANSLGVSFHSPNVQEVTGRAAEQIQLAKELEKAAAEEAEHGGFPSSPIPRSGVMILSPFVSPKITGKMSSSPSYIRSGGNNKKHQTSSSTSVSPNKSLISKMMSTPSSPTKNTTSLRSSSPPPAPGAKELHQIRPSSMIPADPISNNFADAVLFDAAKQPKPSDLPLTRLERTDVQAAALAEAAKPIEEAEAERRVNYAHLESKTLSPEGKKVRKMLHEHQRTGQERVALANLMLDLEVPSPPGGYKLTTLTCDSNASTRAGTFLNSLGSTSPLSTTAYFSTTGGDMSSTAGGGRFNITQSTRFGGEQHSTSGRFSTCTGTSFFSNQEAAAGGGKVGKEISSPRQVRSPARGAKSTDTQKSPAVSGVKEGTSAIDQANAAAGDLLAATTRTTTPAGHTSHAGTSTRAGSKEPPMTRASSKERDQHQHDAHGRRLNSASGRMNGAPQEQAHQHSSSTLHEQHLHSSNNFPSTTHAEDPSLASITFSPGGGPQGALFQEFNSQLTAKLSLSPSARVSLSEQWSMLSTLRSSLASNGTAIRFDKSDRHTFGEKGFAAMLDHYRIGGMLYPGQGFEAGVIPDSTNVEHVQWVPDVEAKSGSLAKPEPIKPPLWAKKTPVLADFRRADKAVGISPDLYAKQRPDLKGEVDRLMADLSCRRTVYSGVLYRPKTITQEAAEASVGYEGPGTYYKPKPFGNPSVGVGRVKKAEDEDVDHAHQSHSSSARSADHHQARIRPRAGSSTSTTTASSMTSARSASTSSSGTSSATMLQQRNKARTLPKSSWLTSSVGWEGKINAAYTVGGRLQEIRRKEEQHEREQLMHVKLAMEEEERLNNNASRGGGTGRRTPSSKTRRRRNLSPSSPRTASGGSRAGHSHGSSRTRGGRGGHAKTKKASSKNASGHQGHGHPEDPDDDEDDLGGSILDGTGLLAAENYKLGSVFQNLPF
ncbi:unnamed protein product [Amoebophrya sp. A25]|nr:unnamed protein product [Amoebophrya sp. A25]|eukprot:GSA25T00014803001.1